MATHDIKREKKFASEYREKKEEVEAEQINSVALQHQVVDITYHTRRGTRTVRCQGAMEQASYNDIPEGFYSFHYDDKKYAYSPEEKRLLTLNDNQNRTVAEGDGFYKFDIVNFPTRAVVEGAADTDVEAKIYYRSPQSDEMQSVLINVSYMEGEAAQITGKEVGSGRRIEATTRWEREIVSKHGTSERTLGKVTRVEFPRGHTFSVDVEGLDDSKAGELGEERIKSRVQKAFRTSNVTVKVTHEGRMEWG